MNYDENVHSTAEEMARMDEPASMKLYDKLLSNAVQTDAVLLAMEHVIERYKPFAIISIRRESEAARSAYIKACEDLGSYCHPDDLDLSNHLIERGLIPIPNSKFHCNNTGRHYSDPGYKPVCNNQCDECKEDNQTLNSKP